MSEDAYTAAEPPTVEQVLKWYDDSESSRIREWRRFMALRDAAEQAMKFGELGALGDVLHALDEPSWIPSSGVESEAGRKHFGEAWPE